MFIKRKNSQARGYVGITALSDPVGINFGVVRLDAGGVYSGKSGVEKAFFVLFGRVEASWGESTLELHRTSLFDEAPVVLHLAADSSFEVRAIEASECILVSVPPADPFEPRILRPSDYRIEQFGEGCVEGAALRTVRTFFDSSTDAESGMVLGEVLNYPGKWSSYPPHVHPQTEVYHYRFSHPQGFGFAQHGDEAHCVHDGDTLAIAPMLPHSQVSAPGYAMYYVWAIPHLPDNKYGPESRDFLQEHRWTLDPKARIWSKS